MSTYLTSLVSRSITPTSDVQPRVPPMLGPVQAALVSPVEPVEPPDSVEQASAENESEPERMPARTRASEADVAPATAPALEARPASVQSAFATLSPSQISDAGRTGRRPPAERAPRSEAVAEVDRVFPATPRADTASPADPLAIDTPAPRRAASTFPSQSDAPMVRRRAAPHTSAPHVEARGRSSRSDGRSIIHARTDAQVPTPSNSVETPSAGSAAMAAGVNGDVRIGPGVREVGDGPAPYGDAGDNAYARRPSSTTSVVAEIGKRWQALPVSRTAEPVQHTVHVSIGRLEVRVAPGPAARRSQHPQPTTSLDEYVRSRNGGGR